MVLLKVLITWLKLRLGVTSPPDVPSWLVGFGMVLSLAMFVVGRFFVGSVGLPIVMVICFGIVLFLLSLRFVNLEFHDLMKLDKSHWPRCLLWHACLPMLSGVNGASLWAVDASESAAYLLEVVLGRYSSGLISEWIPSDEFDHDMAASSLSDHPDVWSDGSLVLDHLTGVSSSGSGFFFSSG